MVTEDCPGPEISQRCSPVVVSDGKSGRRARQTGSGIPTQVVVPSVSRADRLHGTAGTISVEMPSGATLAKPASVSGALTAVGAPRPDGGDISVGGTAVWAEAAEISTLNTVA
jgi:hypothetical protein